MLSSGSWFLQVRAGHPSWSPDGKRLAYQAFAWIDVIDSDGTGHRRPWTKGNIRGQAASRTRGTLPILPALAQPTL
jgi:Tol biopolymer transport system component